MKYSSDKYENILVALIFGMFVVQAVISLLGNNIDILKTSPNTPEWLIQGVFIFWLIVVSTFGFFVIKKGKRIINQQKKEEVESQKEFQKQASTPRMVINYDKVHEEVSEDIKNKSKEGEQKDDKH